MCSTFMFLELILGNIVKNKQQNKKQRTLVGKMWAWTLVT